MAGPLKTRLEQGLQDRQLSDYLDPLWEYLVLLKKWNQAYNLIGDCDDQTLVARHVFDSLSVREYIQPGACLDVGSGAGLPGLILAVTMPDTEWTLLDANGKKTRFCEQACLTLGLVKTQVIQQRIEKFQPAGLYQTIISRAYDQADRFVDQVGRLLAPGGNILAMKGKIDSAEKAAIAALPYQTKTVALDIPELTGQQRHLLIMESS